MKNKSRFLGVAGFTGASSSDEETLLDETTPSTSSITVLEPLPITLNKLKASVTSNNADGQSSSSQNQTDFSQEINKKVEAILTEALFYCNDPREYHPFYLEVDKVISSCQSRGYIGQEEGHILPIWREFDNLARKMMEKGRADLVVPTELSPYALYIRSNEKRRATVGGRLKPLKSAAKIIFEKWKFKNGSKNKMIRDDLEARLEFFQKCKTVTSPSDVIKMNSIWKEFLNGFENPSCEPEPVMIVPKREFMTDADEAPLEIKEEPCSRAFSDHEDAMEDFPASNSPEWEPDESSTTSDENISENEVEVYSARSSQRQRKSSKRKVEEAPAKRLTRNAQGKRIKISTEIIDMVVPPEYKVRVVVEDIARSSKWGAKVKRMLGGFKSSSRTRCLKTTPRKSFSTSINVGTKCRSTKNRSSRSNQKHKKFAVVGHHDINLTTEDSDEMPKNTRKRKESRKMQRYRRRKFEADWKKIRLSVTKICRRRRLHEQERFRRSEKVETTLEYVLAGQYNLRTLKNRKEWFWTPIKILNSTRSSNLTCPFCETRTRPFRNERSKLLHICTAHPRENRNLNWVKDLLKKTENFRKNETVEMSKSRQIKKKSTARSLGKRASPKIKVSTSTLDDETRREGETLRKREHRKKRLESGEGPQLIKNRTLNKKRRNRRSKYSDDSDSDNKITRNRTRSRIRPSSAESTFDCLYCDFKCGTATGRMKHVRSDHPDEVIDYQQQMLKKKREREALRKRELRKQVLETGEGPQWLKDRVINGDRRIRNRQRRICDDCGMSVTSLPKHKANVHNADRAKMNTCPLCSATNTNGAELWLHFTSSHLNYDFRALSKLKGELMGFKYTDSANVESDNEDNGEDGRIITLGPGDYQCDLCAQKFLTNASVKRHLNTVHADKKQVWNCPHCSKTFFLKCSRDAHVKQIHEGHDHRCEICGKKNQSKGKLWRHRMDAHGISEPPEGLNVKKCLYCDEMLLKGMLFHVREKHPDMEAAYLEHVKKEQIEKRKSLKVSKKSYEKNNERRRRLRAQWKEMGVSSDKSLMRAPPKNCPHCGIECTKRNMKGSWADHMKNEHGIEINSRRYVCPVEGCDKSYFEGKKLREHSITHFTLFDKLEEKKYVKREKFAEEKFFRPYLCLMCEKSGEEDDVKGMGSKGEVLVHFAMRHSDIYRKLKGPLEPDLGESWEQLKECQVTLSATAGENKPLVIIEFPCPHCSTGLLTKSALVDHVMVLHPEECWKCPYPDCSQMIISPTEMNLHFDEAHGEAEEMPTEADEKKIQAIADSKFEVKRKISGDDKSQAKRNRKK